MARPRPGRGLHGSGTEEEAWEREAWPAETAAPTSSKRWRGLDVIRVFRPHQPVMSLTAVASAAGLSRPTARRVLLTLEQLGYVRAAEHGFELTPRVLELGMSYVLSRNLWEVARPHMERLVAQTHESSSIAQLDGSDIVYVARVAVPKIVALVVTIGTRFPAMQTSLGKVLLAAMPLAEAERVLAEPSRSGITPRVLPTAEERAATLRQIRARLGADRRGTRRRDPVRGGAAAGRGRPGDRLPERQHPCRGDSGRGADRAVPAVAAADGQRDKRRLGGVPIGAAGHRGPAGRDGRCGLIRPGIQRLGTITPGTGPALFRTTVRLTDP
jgi:DNA-binding IclR family transcriptional regulator